MNETKVVNGTTFCASCYAKASAKANGDEEQGFLLYDLFHYETEHKAEKFIDDHFKIIVC